MFHWNEMLTCWLPVCKRPLKIDKTKILMTSGSILQYFLPALSSNWSWKPNISLFLEWSLKTGLNVLSNGSENVSSCCRLLHFFQLTSFVLTCTHTVLIKFKRVHVEQLIGNHTVKFCYWVVQEIRANDIANDLSITYNHAITRLAKR